MIFHASPAMAGGLVHKMSSSVQLTVDAARTTATRIGSQYSVSGSNVNTTDGTTAGTNGGTITSGVMSPGNIVHPGNCWRGIFLQRIVLTRRCCSTSAPTVGTVGNFSSQTSYTAGVAGDLAGTVATDGGITDAGGAGSSAIGQFVSEITVID